MCAARWPAPKTQPKLSQEVFDDAVRTNMEDFDMSSAEAVKSAVEEFTMQGYDLSCIVKTSAGGDLAKHPIALATEAVTSAGTDAAALTAAYSQLQALLDEAQSEGLSAVQEACAVAVRASTLAALLDSIKGLQPSIEDGDALKHLKAPLALARTLMAGSLDIRDSFDDLGGPALVVDLHKQHIGDVDLQAELASVAECGCFREEQNKECFMEAGYGVSLLQLLQRHSSGPASSSEAGLPEPLVVAACGVLRALTTADDDRPPSSKAFINARLLARQHQALRVLLSLLKRLGSPSSAPTAAAVLATVRQLAANEEICRDFSDDGGVLACLQALKSLASTSSVVVKCGLGALRQLGHSDKVKESLSEQGAAELMIALTAAYPGDAEVAEPAIGLLANITLRQPNAVHLCVEAGVIEWLVETLGSLGPTSGPVSRQGCILTRNLVVRTTEYRARLLDCGVEPLIRAAKKKFPRLCSDVGSAALRDLGLDNYGTMEELCNGAAKPGEYSD